MEDGVGERVHMESATEYRIEAVTIRGLVLVCKNNLQMFSKKETRKKEGEKGAEIGTIVMARVLNAGLLARSRLAF
jgi:hypothetical protein